jgi:ADP-ribose pyrophosphatase
MKITDRKKITNEKWLNLYETTYEKDEKRGKWTFASRRRDDNLGPILEANAVVIVPVLQPNKPHLVFEDSILEGPNSFLESKLVLIKEYRLPIETYEYHFPAGLIERGEPIEDCVQRELKEETGFDLLKINRISPIMTSSAGMTDEMSVMAFVDCVAGDGKQQLEGVEDIEVILLDHKEVCEWAKKPLLFAAKTWTVLLMYEQMGTLCRPVG